MGSKQLKTSTSDKLLGFRWWFVFDNSQSDLLRRMLKPKFSHVYAFCQLGNICLVIEPLFGAVNHVVVQSEAKELIDAAKREGKIVVCQTFNAKTERLIFRSPIVTCSSYLAYTVGLGGLYVTPYQLYKKLMACGAERI